MDTKYYENLLIKKSAYYNDTIGALGLVKKYIIRKKRILVGGMAIDYALKLKGEPGLYTDDVLPDYDFYSDEHFTDAYNLAEWLARTGYKNISVINATHPTTMRVRVNFIVVADITYMPSSVLENIPTLQYQQFIFAHPHYQMIDQHSALSIPYENAPWEVITHRSKKDIERYELLYNLYPLRIIGIPKKEEIVILNKEYLAPLTVLEGECINGFLGLIYWQKKALSYGYQVSSKFGDCKLTDDAHSINYILPVDAHGITLYSNDINHTISNISKISKYSNIRYYNRFLDKLPRKVIFDNEWEILDNHNTLVTAHKLDLGVFGAGAECDKQNSDCIIHVSNIQHLMFYFLINYILLRRIKKIKRGYSFYMAYLECRSIVAWAGKKYYQQKDDKYSEFLPTASIYGTSNKNDSAVLSDIKFAIKNKKLNKDILNKYAQPSNVYDKDLEYKSLNKKYFNFDISKSLLFDIDGEQIDKNKFEELI